MYHNKYNDVLIENVDQGARKLKLDSNFWIQQDNDPKHCAHKPKLGLFISCKTS